MPFESVYANVEPGVKLAFRSTRPAVLPSLPKVRKARPTHEFGERACSISNACTSCPEIAIPDSVVI
eukprot:1649006-Prymnesium_polylepis.1